MDDLKFDTAHSVCMALNELPVLNNDDLKAFISKFPKSLKGIKKFEKCYTKYGTIDFMALKDDKYFKIEKQSKELEYCNAISKIKSSKAHLVEFSFG